MAESGFNKEQRDRLIESYLEVRRRTSWPEVQNLSSKESSELYGQEDELLAEYAEWLPLVAVSRCPYCNEPVEYPIDPFGLDGPWWMCKPIVDFPEPEACKHFQLLLGAVDFHGRIPEEAEPWDDVQPGPGVPYVVPGLLEYKGMCTVVSQRTLQTGDTAYFMAYFMKEPKGGMLRHQPWPRDNYIVLDDEGNYDGWGFSTDVWDFELQPYLESGVLEWIAPNDESLSLKTDSACPYLELPGTRFPQSIEYGVLELGELPDGRPAAPFD